MKQENKFKIILIAILLLIIILFGICTNFNGNHKNENNNYYSNINIDNSKLNIFYFNVGQAYSSLIMHKDKTILIDVGNISDGKEILKFLNSNGIQQIDYLIGTHIHEEHIGGMTDIINNVQVKRIFMPYNEKKQF